MRRARKAVSAVTVTAMTLGFGAALSPGAAARQAFAPVPSSVTAAAVAAVRVAGGTPHKVIVLLRDQHLNLPFPATAGLRSPRALAYTADQVSVVSAAESLGVRKLSQFSIINGFAASMTPAQQAALSRNAAVSAVVPDLQIQRPVDTRAESSSATGAAAGTADAATAISSGACPANPAKPLLEPEALQTMHVAYNTNRVGAQSYTTGTGVKVAFMAEGIDVDNKDFIRPDGSHVIADYKDFSSEGLNGPSGAAEAFGDASSIAAQGRYTYDLSRFVSPAHPLPNGCTIKIRGVAPGASLVALKIFGETSGFTSQIVKAIQYAVQTDKVDVLNESFGANPYADTAVDPLRLADAAAVAAGVTVVSSTGDAGPGSTIGSPASDPGVIAVAATTTYRLNAQTSVSGFGLSNGHWANGNISPLSSSGATQSGRTADIAAPGDSGWVLCSTNITMYQDCVSDNELASPILDFGGTSESAPLVAGTAALVIAAYAKTHQGKKPTPSLVREILTSTAQDLGNPADEQGVGQVDALAAVRAARSMPAPGSTTIPAGVVGSTLLVDRGQFDLSGPAGTTARSSVLVTNISKRPVRVTTSTRALTRVVATTRGAFTFRSSQLPVLIDPVGDPSPYTVRTFRVGKGIDRLDASIAGSASGYVTYLALINPRGVYSAYSLPQGSADFARVEVRYPAAGVWQAVIVSEPGADGRIAYRFTTSRFRSLGTASPAVFTLPPGASRRVWVAMPFTTAPGDRVPSLQLASSAGNLVSIPVVLRSVMPASAKRFSFTGAIDHGNGRRGAPAQSNTYFIDVPAGKAGLAVGVALTGPTLEMLTGYLLSPGGQVLGNQTNSRFTVDRSELVAVRSLQIFRRNPSPGRWRFVLAVANPLNGLQTEQAFRVVINYGPADVGVVGTLPTVSSTISAGSSLARSIRVTNNGIATRMYFADPRLTRYADYRLASQIPGDSLQAVALPAAFNNPQWLLPTETTWVQFHARSANRVMLEAQYIYGDPDRVGPAGKASDVGFTADQLAPGPWGAVVSDVGPFGPGGGTPGTAAVSAVAHTRAFDQSVLSSTGDYWTTSLIPAAAAAQPPGAGAAALSGVLGVSGVSGVSAGRGWLGTAAAASTGPLILAPGQTGYITVVFQPISKAGGTVRGTVFVDTLDLLTGAGDEVAALPYGYTVQ